MKPNSPLLSGEAPLGQSTTPVVDRPDLAEVERIAHHEAGHVVVCFVLYGEQVVKQVDLRGDGDVLWPRTFTYSRLPIPLACRPPSGTPRRGNPAPVSADAIVDAHGILSYAGIAAEILHDGGAPEVDPGSLLLSATQAERMRDDREALAALARTIGVERPAGEFIEAYWHEAMRLVAASWCGVEVMAAALLEHGSLHGDRVDRLLVDAS